MKLDEKTKELLKKYKNLVEINLIDINDFENWEDCQTKSEERWIYEAISDGIKFMESLKKEH